MEIEATPQGAEQSQTEMPQGEADASLLEAYLAQDSDGQIDTDAAAGTPAQADAQVQDDGMFTVKVDGTEMKVSRDDLIANYQKGQASNRRFEEAAQIRQQAQAQLQQFQSQQQMLQNAVQHFQAVAQRYDIRPPDTALLETNPTEYLRQDAMYRQHQGELQKVEAAQAYLQQQQQAFYQQSLEAHLSNENERLLELVPEWKDGEVKARDAKALVSYLQGRGYTDQDIAGLNQSRAANIEIALKAMKYDQLVAKSKTATQQVQKLPPRMERPGAAPQGNGNREAAMQRLGKTGRVEDAAAVLATYFS